MENQNFSFLFDHGMLFKSEKHSEVDFSLFVKTLKPLFLFMRL
ncbi:hypothetical protein PRO82_001753 [Candidatus Protochlamydia amoebophila]|nr:hypothetical protein [Candidatus Protochlamydia amoebophila]